MERTHPSIEKLPEVPGVYLFKKGREVLYIGKATNLRDRVKSYFDDDLIATRGPRIVNMVTRADRVAHEPTPTVLEALVREAALIKQYQPKANVEGKDDKTFLYAVITEEEWPRVLTVRGKDMKVSKSDFDTLPFSHVCGPFPSGPQLREALRLIRRIFPFYDTPKPVTTTSKHVRAKIEFNRQIEHYPRELDAEAYRHTIRHVALLLSGKGKELRRTLERDMRRAAREERFEDAIIARRELYALNHVQDVSLIKEENLAHQGSTLRILGEGRTLVRVEAYDTAHLAGTNAIGVMVVVVSGVPSKRDYRSFTLRGKDFVSPSSYGGLTKSPHGRRINDDIASLKEILARRLAHPEWPLPSAIVVDGGKAQKKAAEQVIAEADLAIKVVAVVKDERHRPREIIGGRIAGVSDADAVLANSEAHRFSLARHRAARSRGLRTK